MSLLIKLPFIPPSKPNSYKIGKHGLYADKITKLKEQQMKAAAQISVSDSSWQLTDKPVKITITVQKDSKRRFDIDNILKSLLDSLTGIVYSDDSQVYEISVKKLPPGKAAETIVVIEMLD